MTPPHPAWTALHAHQRELATLASVSALVAWDQQTYMPPAAGAFRGEQMALMAKLIHQQQTDPKVGSWIDDLAHVELPAVEAGGLRNITKSYHRATCLSADFVERFARAEANGFERWMAAKAGADFSLFEGALQTLVDLTLEKCDAIDPDRHPYDVLLDDFDPGMTVAQLKTTFSRLRVELVRLIQAIKTAKPKDKLTQAFPLAGQRSLQQQVIAALGYDLNAGRLDGAEHPFTIGLGLGDVRITNHLDETDLLSGLGGTVHEAGHGMYEQGLPAALFGTGAGEAASLGLHESQSRFWENFIGRSRPFFEWLQGPLSQSLPNTPVSVDQLYTGANCVQPGLIRVTADEVTYNLHVIIRFELELDLLERRLKVKDLPAAWNAKYQETLGVCPTNDAEGVLQDIHWAHGMFGYFPSYTIGNLYAASFAKTLLAEHPALWDDVRSGTFAPTLNWLREHVHHRAHVVDAPQIVRDAVGETDLVEELVSYLWERHGALYGLRRDSV